VSRGGRRRTRWGDGRGSAIAALVCLAVWLAMTGLSGAVPVQSGTTGIELRGEGTDDADAVLLDLDTAADSSKAGPDLNYISTNEFEGLKAFADGRTDYFVGAQPLADIDPDAAAKATRDRGVISAPFQATGAVPFISGPRLSGGFRWCGTGLRFDETIFDFVCDDPNGVVALSDTAHGAPGRLRLNPAAIALMFSDPGNLYQEPNFASQADPTGCPIAADGTCQQRLLAPPAGLFASGVRTDRSAINAFLQTWMRSVDRTAFESKVLTNVAPADRPSFTITNQWPNFGQASRSPGDTLAATIRTWESPAGGVAAAGAGALVHPLKARTAVDLAAQDAAAGRPKTDLWIADFVHRGQVVAATPDAITAAVAAGGEVPFFAAYNDVPGAWPMSWVNRIHLPAKGLSVDQTNAAAMMIRLQLTKGQDDAARLGDGRLTPTLVNQGLAAAEQVVVSNCQAAKGTVVKEVGAGPFTPAGAEAALVALGSVSWCQPTEDTPPPSPRTEAPYPNSDVGPGSALPALPSYDPYDSSSVPLEPLAGSDLVPLEVPAGPIDTSAAPPAEPSTTTTVKDDGVEKIAATLPMSIPGTGLPGLDKLATVVLGAALFFGVRAVWRTGVFHSIAGVGR